MMLLRSIYQSLLTTFTRSLSSHISLKDCLAQKIIVQREVLKCVQTNYGKETVDAIRVNQICGGMRDMTTLLSEISYVHPYRGILWRGLDLSECVKLLPKTSDGSHPLPEGILWLLLTGDIPTESQVKEVSEDLRNRRNVPHDIMHLISSLESSTSLMARLSAAVVLMNTRSMFKRAYEQGVRQGNLWECAYEDSMYLIANLPELAAIICTGGQCEYIKRNDEADDWAGSFADLLGFEDDCARDLMRSHLFIFADHDLGNVSAHTSHLVGSALADPFLSYSSGINGLSGPLQGQAQITVRFVSQLLNLYGESPSDEQIINHIDRIFRRSPILPGFGHAVLRVVDPRFLHIREFALQHFPDDPYVKIVEQLFRLVPSVTKSSTENAYPNANGYSGITWNHFGVDNPEFSTVLTAVSRSLGVLSQYIWSRALLLPLERPKYISTEQLIKLMEDKPCEQNTSLETQQMELVRNKTLEQSTPLEAQRMQSVKGKNFKQCTPLEAQQMDDKYLQTSDEEDRTEVLKSYSEEVGLLDDTGEATERLQKQLRRQETSTPLAKDKVALSKSPLVNDKKSKSDKILEHEQNSDLDEIERHTSKATSK